MRVPSSHSVCGSEKIIFKSFNRMKYMRAISKVVKICILDRMVQMSKALSVPEPSLCTSV